MMKWFCLILAGVMFLTACADSSANDPAGENGRTENPADIISETNVVLMGEAAALRAFATAQAHDHRQSQFNAVEDDPNGASKMVVAFPAETDEADLVDFLKSAVDARLSYSLAVAIKQETDGA